ncbi:MAG: hypothetical protein ACRDS1_07710 [Pseudonocardiaceae bacterium]
MTDQQRTVNPWLAALNPPQGGRPPASGGEDHALLDNQKRPGPARRSRAPSPPIPARSGCNASLPNGTAESAHVSGLSVTLAQLAEGIAANVTALRARRAVEHAALQLGLAAHRIHPRR